MEELSIEEKAKRYDEAIEKANSKWHYKNQPCFIDVVEIFPELAESNDEKIRKDIIWCLKHSGIKESNPINPHVTTIIKDAIAWLEKQGEKKSAWTPIDEQRVENLLAIIEGHGYPGEVAWLNSLKDRVQPKQEWSEDDMNMIVTLVSVFEVNYPDGFYKVNSIGTTNMQGIYSSEIIKWLKSLKDRLQLK